VRGRIGQRTDDLHLLDDRTRPAMRDDHRQGVLVPGTHVNEVDVDAVDLGDELRQSVQPRLHLAPVIVGLPVANELLDGRELHALRLVGNDLAIRPACRGETAAQIEQIFLRHVDEERTDCAAYSGLCRTHRKQARRARGNSHHRGLAQQLTAIWVHDVGSCLRRHFGSPSLWSVTLTEIRNRQIGSS
jgi:hypothetical protein